MSQMASDSEGLRRRGYPLRIQYPQDLSQMASDSEGLRLEPAHIDWPLARPIVANGFRFGRVTTFPGTGIPRPGFRRKWLPIRKGYDVTGVVTGSRALYFFFSHTPSHTHLPSEISGGRWQRAGEIIP